MECWQRTSADSQIVQLLSVRTAKAGGGGCNHFPTATVDLVIRVYCLTFSDSPAIVAAGSEFAQQGS